MLSVAEQVSLIGALLDNWRVPRTSWFVVDAVALHLLGYPIDPDAWADHVNVYVDQNVLPWRSDELEETIPPPGSQELADWLRMMDRGAALHLVPARRYIERGIDVVMATLPDGNSFQVVSLRGYLRLGVLRAGELMSNVAGEAEAVIRSTAVLRFERASQLPSELFGVPMSDCVVHLREGYRCLAAGDIARGRKHFEAAGDLAGL